MLNDIRALIVPAISALALALPVTATASTISETFDFPSGSFTQDEAFRAIGWEGGNAGDSFLSNPPGTIDNQGGEGAVSVGLGEDGAQGFAFWSQKSIGADGFMYTSQSPFRSTATTSLSWYQNDSGMDPMHVAFLIGSTWFISNDVFNSTDTDKTTWETQNSIDFSTAEFFQREMFGSTLPGGGVSVGSSTIAAGTLISSWGFWFDGPKSANTRIDSVLLDDVAPVPLPAAAWMLLAGVGGLAAVARRRKTA